MVYCGKPSQGCGTCRARKVNCDQERPICARCRKSKRTCVGYRDQLSLRFRDESKSVARKAKAASNSSPYNGDQLAADCPGQAGAVPVQKKDTLDASTELNFGVDWHFHASCFFSRTYPWYGPSHLEVRSGSSYNLRSTSEALGMQALKAGSVAVGLSHLANLQNASSLLLSGRKEYIKALNLTNAALRDATQVKEDTTIAAVVCLSLFEVITCQGPSLRTWENHSKGIGALLEYRGREQFQRQNSFRLFQVVRNQVLYGCLQRRTRVPSILVNLPEWMGCSPIPYMDRLSRTVAEFCALRADIDSRCIIDGAEILSRATTIDSELADFATSLPESFFYSTIPTSDKNQSFLAGDDFPHLRNIKSFHVYQSDWECNVLNNYRVTRIFVNEVIIRQFRSAINERNPYCNQDHNLASQLKCDQVLELMRQLADDICASIPYKMGSVDTGGNGEPILKRTTTTITAGVGITLLLPLFVAGIVDGSAGSTCRWTMECLEMIRRMTGVNMALTLRDLLKDEPGMMSRTDIIGAGADNTIQA